MAEVEVIPANLMPFEDFCVTLEKLHNTKKRHKNYMQKNKPQKLEQSSILENFFNTFKIKAGALSGKKNSTVFPILRLLLPNLERERSPYNLKESKLGPLLVKVLSLSKQSPVAQKLLNFRSVSNSQDSDFAGVAYFALKNIVGKQRGTLTIGDINEILDKIATAEVGNKGPVLDEAFSYALKNLSAEQLKWFLRLILKNLRLGIDTNRILAAFHPDAPEYFKNCNSLSKVCSELEEEEARPPELGVRVFLAVSPMLSERLDVTHVEAKLDLRAASYLVENKFDGERFQIHMENGIFEYFSRKGHKYSDNYGKTYETGIFTPFLKNCFNPEVTSFILDGEMMGWHKVEQRFSSKGEPFDVKKITTNSVYHPCFCAFDILYYNGRPLVGPPDKGGVPLKERLKILDALFTEVKGYIHHSIREPVKNGNEILEKLNKAVEDEEEGIVVKDEDSYYLASKRNAGWYKIKIEYTEGTMNDLDFVIIGADEAANKKQGQARCFHVACVDREEGGGGATRWVCVGHVSTGLTADERSRLCAALSAHWQRTAPAAPPPPHLVFNRETPDFWILPEHSTVLQVRATELIRSTSYGAGYTLRFPRVVRVRDDKPVADVITLADFKALATDKAVSKLGTHLVNPDLMSGVSEKIRKKRPPKVIQVAEQFRVTAPEAVEVTSKALLGRKICILSADEDCSKVDLRKIVESHSGTFVSNIGEDTWVAIVGRITRRENEVIKSGTVDVASSAWLRSLAPAPRPDPSPAPPPLELLAARRSTGLALARRYDCYGDSYTEPVDEDTLRKCFQKMDTCEPRIYLTKQEMLNLDRELFGERSPFSFLRQCSIHVANNSGLHAARAALRGATLCDLLTPTLTHIVLCKTTNADDVASLKKRLNAIIVSEEWLDACFERNMLVPETEYLL